MAQFREVSRFVGYKIHCVRRERFDFTKLGLESPLKIIFVRPHDIYQTIEKKHYLNYVQVCSFGRLLNKHLSFKFEL